MNTKEKYLKTIYRLTEAGEKKTTTSELSSHMEVSDASSSEAVQKLEEENLVCRAAYKGFTLSPMGKKEGEKFLDKNNRLEKFFEEIGVEDPEEEAGEVAHVISEETLGKMESLVE